MSRPPGGERPGAVRSLFALIGGALDGFVIGFAITFVAATTLSGVGRALGLGPIGDMVASLAAVIVVLGIPFAVLVGITLVAGWFRNRLEGALQGSWVPSRLGTLLVLSFRVIAAVVLRIPRSTAGAIAVAGYALAPAP
jgi:hypothetical protein